ncbi:MAG: aminoacyl-tRNA hydrolase [Thermodesulfobacteriota bacterium]|nr:aminoacyl-tRNA hydrolase [Thermodesulfobacteriota bacterium]
MELVVGLGNHGEYYRRTRHNIGFLVVERLAKENKIEFSQERFHSKIGKGTIVDKRVILAKPLTYMNLSGKAVKKLIIHYEIDPKFLIVVHDDLDMEFGKIKIKEKGGHAGHNGIRSIIDTIGTKGFLRLKVGIGRPDRNRGVKDYVLSSFDIKQQGFLPDVIDVAAKAAISVITDGVKAAMNEFNRKSFKDVGNGFC